MTIESDLVDQRNQLGDARARAERYETIVAAARTLHSVIAERAERLAEASEPTQSDAEIVGVFDRFLKLQVPAPILREPLTGLPFEGLATAVEELLAARDDRGPLGRAAGREFRGGRGRGRRSPNGATERREAVVAAFRDLIGTRTPETMAQLATGLETVAENAVEGRRSVYAELDRIRSDHVATLREADDRDIDPLTALEWDAPIALLPVRLETRFVDEDGGVGGEPTALRVRVYPEQIHVDSHEPELTDRERTWGQTFWAHLWLGAHELPPAAVDAGEGGSQPAGYDPTTLPENLRQPVADLYTQLHEFSQDGGARYDEIRERAWTRGVEAFGRERAAWVVHALSPVSDAGDPLGAPLLEGWSDGDSPFAPAGPPALRFPPVPDRPASWSRQPRARLLPDRWVVRAHWTDESGTERVERATSEPVTEPLHVAPDPSDVSPAGTQSGEPIVGEGVDWMVDYAQAKRAGMAVTLEVPDGFDPDDGFSLVEVTGLRTSTDRESDAETFERLLDAHHYTDGLSFLSAGTPTNNADEPSGFSSTSAPAASAETEVGPPLVTAGDGSDGDLTAKALGLSPSENARHVFEHVAGAAVNRTSAAGDLQRVLWPATLGYYAKHFFLPWNWSTLYDGEAGITGDRSSLAQELTGREVLSWIGAYREHFVEYVRADGPLGTLRTGRQPYGLLPVTPLDITPGSLPRQSQQPDEQRPERGSDDWTPATLPEIDEPAVFQSLLEHVWGFRETWLSAADEVATVHVDDTGQSLLNALGLEAIGTRYRRRSWLLDDDHPAFGSVIDEDRFDTGEAVVAKALTSAGFDVGDVRLDELLWLGLSARSDDLAVADAGVTRFAELLVTILDDAGDWAPLNPLQMLGTPTDGDTVQTAVLELVRAWVFGRYRRAGFEADTLSVDTSLLRQLLLLAVQRACASSRLRLGTLYHDPASVGPEPTAYAYGDRTVYDDLAAPIDSALSDHPSLSGDDTYEDAIGVSVAGVEPPVDPVTTEFRASLGRITTDDYLDADTLDRLTRGALDLCSHRLDAWWTSIATRRLRNVRQDESGLHVGAYAHVTDLSPDPAPDAEYLLAPSQNQATSAAILRNGHKANADTPHGETLAVDLSADRVKAAKPYLMGVRNGSSLSELLGYRFERGLHAISDDPTNSVTDAEQYIAPFRVEYPSVASRLDHGGTEPTAPEASAASDVVDGLALYRAWKDDAIPWNTVLSGAGPAVRQAIEELLAAIDEEMDAVNDLFTAESVHQLAKGNPGRASAALSALSRGEMTHDPEVLDTPRTTTGVTHRLMVLFGDAERVEPPEAWEPGRRNLLELPELPEVPRLRNVDLDRLDDGIDRRLLDPDRLAELIDEPRPPDVTTLEGLPVRPEGEPALNAWVGEQLPAPGRVGCPAVFRWQTERSFATGSLESPTAAQTVSVTDIGFEPDMLVFTAAAPVETVTERPTEATGGAGWLRGVAHRRDDGSVDQHAISVTVGGSASSYATSSTSAVHAEVRTADGATGTVTATVDATTDDGFELRFTTVDVPGEMERLSLSYTALKTGDTSGLRIGSFVADPPAAADVDDEPPATQTVDLDILADHVQLTATTRADRADATGAGPEPGGISRGVAVRDEGVSQQVIAETVDPATGDSAQRVGTDAVLDLLYPSGGTVASRTRARVSDFSGSELELTYEHGGNGTTTWNDAPRLVTFVAVTSATHETSEGRVGGPPELGTVTVPDGGGRVSVETAARPGLISVTGIPGIAATAGDDPPQNASIRDGLAGWSDGVAVGSAAQTVRGYGARTTGVAGDSSDQHVLALPTVGQDGSVTGTLRGKIASVTDDGFALEFTGDGDSVQAGEQTVLSYTAWPAEPSERAFAVSTECTLDSLDLSPLDALAFAKGPEAATGTELEQRIGYHLFRSRPTNRPPIPDEAELELALADPPDTGDVSVAAVLEQARALQDLLGDARPASASDLAHPSAASDDGYLPDEASVTTDPTAEDLASRADEVGDRLTRIEAALDNRLAVIDASAQAPTLLEMADRLAAAAADLDGAAPLPQLVETVERVAAYAQPNATTQSLPAELRRIATQLPVGPIGPPGSGDDVIVRPEPDRTLTLQTGVSNTDVTVTLGSTSQPAVWETWAVTTDDDGYASVTVDLDHLPAGTGLLMTAAVDETLAEATGDALSRLSIDERVDLLDEVADRRLDEAHRDRLRAYRDLSSEERAALLDALPGRVLARILSELGLDDRFGGMARPGEPVAREVLGTQSFRVVPEAATDSAASLEAALDEEFRILPRLLWLRRVLAVLDPTQPGTPGKALADAVADADWTGLRAEASLADRVDSFGTGGGGISQAERQAIRALLELEYHELDELAGAVAAVLAPLDRLGVTELVAARGTLARPWDQRHTVVDDAEIESPLARGPSGEVRGRIESYLAEESDALPAAFTGFSPGFREFLAAEVDDPVAVGRAIAALVRAPRRVVTALDPSVTAPHLLVRDLTALTAHRVVFAQHGDVAAFEERLSDTIDALERPESQIRGLLDERTGAVDELSGALDGAVPALTTHALRLRANGPPTYGQHAAAGFAASHDTALDELATVTRRSIADRIRPVVAGPNAAMALRKVSLEALRHALVRASYFGVYGATPESPTGASPEDEHTLVRQARAVVGDLRDKRTAARSFDPDEVSTEPTVDGQVDRIQAMLGEEFQVLPTFAPSNPTEIRSAFAASDAALAGDPYATETWLQRIARVRDKPATFRDTRTYADALSLSTPGNGDTGGELTVGQLAHGSSDHWIGRDDETPDGGELSLVAQFASTASTSSPLPATPGRNGDPPIAGLLIDGWIDSVHATEETLGVGLQYDDPGARAPQSALLAVPPAWEHDDDGWTTPGPLGWSREAVWTTLSETRDLVSIRGVDLDALDELGHLVPGLVFPYNDTTVAGSGASVPDAPSVAFDRFDWFEGGE